MKNTLAIAAAFILAACASPAPVQTAAAPAAAAATTTDNEGKVCTREYRVGSMVPTTICRTQEQIDQERKAAELATDTVRRQRVIPGASGPAGM